MQKTFGKVAPLHFKLFGWDLKPKKVPQSQMPSCMEILLHQILKAYGHKHLGTCIGKLTREYQTGIFTYSEWAFIEEKYHLRLNRNHSLTLGKEFCTIGLQDLQVWSNPNC